MNAHDASLTIFRGKFKAWQEFFNCSEQPFLHASTKALTERYAKMVALRFEGLSLAAVGKEIGISPEQVRQRLAKFTERIDDYLRALKRCEQCHEFYGTNGVRIAGNALCLPCAEIYKKLRDPKGMEFSEMLEKSLGVHFIDDMPHTVLFTIPLKPITWNTIAAKNRWTYKKIKDQWQAQTLYAIREAQIKPIRGSKVEIGIHARWKQRRLHDACDLYAKAIIDQLVYSGILEDDSLEYVERVTFSGTIGQPRDEMVVTIKVLDDVL